MYSDREIRKAGATRIRIWSQPVTVKDRAARRRW
jgi:hypothetical protein